MPRRRVCQGACIPSTRPTPRMAAWRRSCHHQSRVAGAGSTPCPRYDAFVYVVRTGCQWTNAGQCETSEALSYATMRDSLCASLPVH